jgi:hypothetical protein
MDGRICSSIYFIPETTEWIYIKFFIYRSTLEVIVQI